MSDKELSALQERLKLTYELDYHLRAAESLVDQLKLNLAKSMPRPVPQGPGESLL